MVTRVLIIDPDVEAAATLRVQLEEEGIEVTSTVTGQAGLLRAETTHPNLVVLDVDVPDVDGYHLCRTLRASPTSAAVPILIYSSRGSVPDKVAGFEAGASDYVVKPAAPAELLARIRTLARLEEPTYGRLITVWGSKGGVGTSTIASNLAVALRTATGKRVSLVDASVLGGTVGVLLNIVYPHTLADLLPRLDALDSELLDSVMARHSSGVQVLLSPPWGVDGLVHLEASHLERILNRLRQISDYVVVDTAPSVDPATVAALRRADQSAIVFTPEMSALRNVRVFLRMGRVNGDAEQLLLVLNRYPIKGGLRLQDVESALERPVDVLVPNDEALVLYSINRGIPLVTSHPRSPVSRGMLQLAQLVLRPSGRGK